MVFLFCPPITKCLMLGSKEEKEGQKKPTESGGRTDGGGKRKTTTGAGILSGNLVKSL